MKRQRCPRCGNYEHLTETTRWNHRTKICMECFGEEAVLTMTQVHPLRGTRKWYDPDVVLDMNPENYGQ